MGSDSLTRRGVLLGLLGAWFAPAPFARAEGKSEVTDVKRDVRGTTLVMDLETAPFPDGKGGGFRDSTVFVFIPSYFRDHGTVDVLVHFHGHNTTAEEALEKHQLREQVIQSGSNIILVVPQGPVHAESSECGKLAVEGGLLRMLNDIRKTAQRARTKLKKNALSTKSKWGSILLSAHSGGYHGAAMCAKHGGVGVNQIFLFDALYNDSEIFREWAIATKGKKKRHRIVSFHTDGTTGWQSKKLGRELEEAGLTVSEEDPEGALSRYEFATSDMVIVHTALPHSACTHEKGELRDCIMAAGLSARTRNAWHKKGKKPRWR